MGKKSSIGVFITSHGFGHATRTCAVLNEIYREQRSDFVIFSTIPHWFFSQNLNCANFELVSIKTDIGLVQKNPFTHDLDQTFLELQDFLSFNDSNFNKALELSKDKKFELILCDISPLGLEVASRLGIPSVLLENFTWDWIYDEYLKIHSGWADIIERIREVSEKASLHIQAKPFCSGKKDSLKVPPISRSLVKDPLSIKKSLECDPNSRIILLTTGGITTQLDLTHKLKSHPEYTFIVSGDFKEISRDQNVLSLPMNSHVHYPDIVNASSLVVGKVGYGTLSECYATSTPLLGCYRDNFKESDVLRNFAINNLTHSEISIDDFQSMKWTNKILKVLQEAKIGNRKIHSNGANLAATYIRNFIN